MRTPIYTGLFQSDLDANGYRISGLLAPSASTDAANKAYVDAHAGGGSSGLDANTVTASSIGLVGDGVTDNTTALQTWLNSVGVAKVNSTLLVPDGVYVFSGPLQDGSRRNAQILLPTVASTDNAYSITIKGYHPINFVYWPAGAGQFPIPKGPVFKTTLATGSGTRPAFIGGRGPVGGPGPEDNYLMLRLENIVFQTVPNPQISCLNFDHMSYTQLMGDVLIVAGGYTSEGDVVQPTTSTSYGLIYPAYSLSILHICDNVNVMGFYNGILLGENCILSFPGVWNCVYGFECGFAYGVVLVHFMSIGHCTYGLNITGAANIMIYMFNTEHNSGGLWSTLVYDIVDPTNQAKGDITWWQNTAFVGPGTDFRMNGGAYLNTRRLGGIPLPNSSVTSQSLSTSDVYLGNSNVAMAAGNFLAKGQYRCVFDVTKSAGTGAIVITLRMGTAATTSDAAILTFTFGAGTAVADAGTFEVIATWRTVGSGTSAVMQGVCRASHNLATTGLFNNAAAWTIVGATSSGFNSTTATQIGISFNGSTAFAGTTTLVQATLNQ